MYVVLEQKFVKKIEMGSNKIIATYEPLVDMNIQTGGSLAGYDHFVLKSIDTWYNSKTNLFLYYECFKAADNKISYMIANYNMEDKKTDILIFRLSDYASDLYGGEIGGITPIYSPYNGLLSKVLYIGGIEACSFLLTSESPISMSYSTRRRLMIGTEYQYTYRGMSYANLKIEKSEGFDETVATISNGHISLMFESRASETPVSNISITEYIGSNCLREFLDPASYLCGGRGIIEKKNNLYPIGSLGDNYSRTFTSYLFDKSYTMVNFDHESGTIYYQISEDTLYRMGKGNECQGPGFFENYSSNIF